MIDYFKNQIRELKERVASLEAVSHPPIAQEELTELLERVSRLEVVNTKIEPICGGPLVCEQCEREKRDELLRQMSELLDSLPHRQTPIIRGDKHELICLMTCRRCAWEELKASI